MTGSVWVRFVAMASFVTEVLTHSGSLEKEDLGTRISRLTRRVEEIKVRAGRRPPTAAGCGAPGESPESEPREVWRIAWRAVTKAWDCEVEGAVAVQWWEVVLS